MFEGGTVGDEQRLNTGRRNTWSEHVVTWFDATLQGLATRCRIAILRAAEVWTVRMVSVQPKGQHPTVSREEGPPASREPDTHFLTPSQE